MRQHRVWMLIPLLWIVGSTHAQQAFYWKGYDSWGAEIFAWGTSPYPYGTAQFKWGYDHSIAVFDGGSIRNIHVVGQVNTGGIVFQNGSWTLSGGSLRLAPSSEIDTGTGAVTITSALTDGSLVKIGAGSLTFSGTNTYTGPTVISQGTLQFGKRSALYNGTTANWTAANLIVRPGTTAAFHIGGEGEFTAADLNLLKTLGTNTGGFMDGASLGLDTSNASGGNFIYNSTIGNSNGGANTLNLVKLGSGTLTLGAANTYTGSTAINQGTLAIAANDRLPTATAVSIASGATLDLAGFDQTIGSIAGSGSITLGSGSLSVGGSNASTTFSGVISGSGSLIKTGSGTLSLGGVNAYTGPTIINQGRLTTTWHERLPDSTAVFIASGATFDISSYNETVGSIAGDGGINIYGGVLTVGGNNTSTTFSGVISGTGFNGALTKVGSGTLTLSGANTYNGPLIIRAGTVAMGGNDRLHSWTDVTVASGATFDLAGFNQTVDAITGSGNITLGSGSLTVGSFISYTPSSFTFDGVISGSGSLTKIGLSTLILGGENTYTGSTLINQGTLAIAGNERLSDSTNVTLASGATFNLAGFHETVGSIAGSANIALGSGSLTTGGNNTSTTFSGVISGSGSFTKTGSGTLTLSGENTYNGPLLVDAGTLRVEGSIVGATTVNAGGTLAGTGSVGPVTLAAGGTISPGNSLGTLTTGSQTWEGGAIYVWELSHASDTDDAKGITYDWLNISGTLDITATPENKFMIYVASLTEDLTSGATSGFTPGQSYTYILVTASGGITNFSATKFHIDTSAFYNDPPGDGRFAISQIGNNLVLTYTAVPEPAAWSVLLGLALAGLALLRRRSLRRPSVSPRL